MTVELPGPLPALGARVVVAPNHACNAVNLHNYYVLSYHVLSATGPGSTPGPDETMWAVDARGMN